MEHPMYSQEFLNNLVELAENPETMDRFNEECPFDLDDLFLDHACRTGNLGLIHWRFETRRANLPDQVFFFLLALFHRHYDIAEYIRNVYSGLDTTGFARMPCVTLIGMIVDDDNVDAMKILVDSGFCLEGDEESTYDIVTSARSRSMIRLLHLQAHAEITSFRDYFRDFFLSEGRYEVIEYMQENGISIYDVDISQMDMDTLQSYHESLINYSRWLDLRTKALTRIQRKIFFTVFPKIYSNHAFVMAQASRAYDTLFGEISN